MISWFDRSDAMSCRERGGGEAGLRAARIVRSAVALLRADVAVLVTEHRALLVAADGIEPDQHPRDLVEPLVALARGYRGQVSVPFWRGGRKCGALVVLTREVRQFDQAEVDLLRALATKAELLDSAAIPSLH